MLSYLYYHIVICAGFHWYLTNSYFNTKILSDVKHACFSLILTCGSLYGLYTDSFYAFYIVTVLELSYYVCDFFYKIVEKDYIYALHHATSLPIMLYLINGGDVKHVLMIYFVASVTNIFLSISTVLHKLDYTILSTICFSWFFILFFVSRVCLGTILFYRLHFMVTDPLILMCVYTVYSLQLFWFWKIIQFTKKLLSRQRQIQ